MEVLGMPEAENENERIICVGQNICTPLSILEGLMAPRTSEILSQANIKEEVEDIVTDTDCANNSERRPSDKAQKPNSTADFSTCILQGNSVLSEVIEEPGAQTSPGDCLSLGSSRRHYVDGTVPDLLRSGSPLRRRVSSPVSNTLKEVRREVELSRRRSLKLKAQVEKLQNQNDSNWTQHKQRVTEEIQSVLRLLLPLADGDMTHLDPSSSESPLDESLHQLQLVSRTLAMNHTKGKPEEGDSAILQQALRDRDEAVAKKKAMEMELLNSKTEMMLLNNQLLEAVQHRLELSLELEAWKEDFQLLLQQQVILQQQQAEQPQRKGGLLGTLGRKAGKASPKPAPSSTPSPSSSPMAAMATSTPATDSPKTPSEREAPNRWRVKLRRGRTSKGPDNTCLPAENTSQCTYPSPGGSRLDTFHTISLE